MVKERDRGRKEGTDEGCKEGSKEVKIGSEEGRNKGKMVETSMDGSKITSKEVRVQGKKTAGIKGWEK